MDTDDRGQDQKPAQGAGPAAAERESQPAASVPAAPGLLPVAPPRGGPAEARAGECAAALVRGDFHEARRVARELHASEQASAEEKQFAAEVLRRTDVDPVALGAGMGALILFWIIVWLTLWR